jgi:co-chaperonin GroES (HSP10)
LFGSGLITTHCFFPAQFRNIKPLFDRVLIERVQPVTKSAGGILLPESTRSKLNEGIVRAIGMWFFMGHES